MLDKVPIRQDTYKGLPINTSNQNLGCIPQILDRIQGHLQDMLNKHAKVMLVRFDLHYPADGTVKSSHQHLHNFNYNFQRKLNRIRYAGGHRPDPRLITVIEQHHSSQFHIHGCVLINANAQNKYYPILLEIEKQWKQALSTKAEGLVHFCNTKENGIIIDRNKHDFQNKLEECHYQVSYLAKSRGKENLSKGTWLVTGTRVPKYIKPLLG